MKQYLADNDISESAYLNPQWSNALERIAIQRAVEANSYTDGHTRLNGEICFTASYENYGSSGEILAWGSQSFSGAMDQWATEKSDWVNQTPGAVTGHYTTLIDPDNKAYGFGAASSQQYGSTYAGEATQSSGWDTTATGLQGTYTVEANLSKQKLAQGISSNVPSTLTAGSSFKPVVKAKVYNERFTMRGTWSSSDDGVAKVESDGSITGVSAGNAVLTFTFTDGTKNTFNITVKDKAITSVTNPEDMTVESSATKPTGQLPTTVKVTYDDQSTGEAKVTWTIPDDWNANRKEHTITLTGTVEGTDKTATLNLKVQAASIDNVAADGDTNVTVPSGTNPASKLPKTATVNWSNGSSDQNVSIKWESNDGYKNRDGGTYTLTGTVGNTGETVTANVTVTAATVTSVDQLGDDTVSKGGKPSSIPSTVKTHWSNGDTTNETIVWDDGQDPKDASFDALGSTTFTGTAAGQIVSWTVNVVEARVDKVYDPDPITVESGTNPTDQLPDTVEADLDNGKKQNVSVKWDTDAIPNTWKDRKGGSFEVQGVANGQNDKVITIKIIVKPATINNVTLTDSISTPAGIDLLTSCLRPLTSRGPMGIHRRVSRLLGARLMLPSTPRRAHSMPKVL